MIRLSRDADYVEMTELAEELLKLIESCKRERAYNEGNPKWQIYLDGLVSAYQSVLSKIGYEEEEQE